MKKKLAALVLAGSLSISSPATAAVQCLGTLSRVITYDNGDVRVYASWRSNYTQICNLKTIWKGIDPQTCWGWFAQANTAVTESRTFAIYYSALSPGDCPNLRINGDSPAPTYLVLL